MIPVPLIASPEALPVLLAEQIILSEDKVWPGGHCWFWTGRRDKKGYGRVSVAGQSFLVHRLVYELVLEPIPDRMTLDHLCQRPPCCRPTHMEPVDRSENSRRAAAARMLARFPSPPRLGR